ncbi:MAG: hypothetical protein WCA30_00735 [Dermatophilaceae bacterium]
MNRKLTTMLSALALAALAANPATADGARHDFQAEDYDAYEQFAPGEGPCVPWAGTFHEVRSGGYRLVTTPDGPDPGEIHINGVIAGLIELIPANPTLPTYTGTYREKVNGVATSFGDNGDTARIAQYRLRSTLTGTDGSALQLQLAGKLTMNANGDLVVSRNTFTCQ